jgi:hypothetical protein
MASSGDDSWRSGIALTFRAAVFGQTIAVLGQALLAGLAISGDARALAAHMINGGLALLISGVQVVFGVLMKSQLPRWALIASVALFLGEGIQMASGRLHLFAVHLPLGLALFAGLVPLVLWLDTGHAVLGVEDAEDGVSILSRLSKSSTGGKQ